MLHLRKKTSQTWKCKQTTSGNLGVRICGMQVFKVSENRYTFQDKYFGRQVLTQDFTSTLANFFHDGNRFLVYQIPSILRKLYKLASIISKLDRYRFYAASLLFIYDGDQEVQRDYENHLKLSAEENRRGMNELGPHRQDPGPTDSYPRQYPSSTGHPGWVEVPSSTISPTTLPDDAHHQSSDDPVPSFRPHSRRQSTERFQDRTHRTEHENSHHPGEVNIRLIDFAHCTTGDDFLLPDQPINLDDPERPRASFPPSHPNQPDCGFLLGLKSLCAALKEIWEIERSKRQELMRIVDPDDDGRQDHGQARAADDRHDDHPEIDRLGPLDVSGADVWEVIFGPGAEDCGVGQEFEMHAFASLLTA